MMEQQRKSDITADNIRAAVKFVTDLAEQRMFHPCLAAQAFP
jgi:hypothetical protein